MTNGIDHNLGNGTNSEKPSAAPKQDVKPETVSKPRPAQKSGKQAK
jgi:hypothetical protein